MLCVLSLLSLKKKLKEIRELFLVMTREMFKSKIHRATITEADLNYEGSLTVDPVLLEAADMLPYERVNVYNIDNGNRFETYIMEGEKGSGTIGLNGAAARKGHVGDKVILVTYASMNDEEAKNHQPKIILVDENNRVSKKL
jgi:aspartate 1-decarboxylase